MKFYKKIFAVVILFMGFLMTGFANSNFYPDMNAPGFDFNINEYAALKQAWVDAGFKETDFTDAINAFGGATYGTSPGLPSAALMQSMTQTLADPTYDWNKLVTDYRGT